MTPSISLTDIKYSVRDLLKSEFPFPIHKNEAVEGFRKPCFFIEVSDIVNFYNRRTVTHEAEVEISYFQKKSDEVDKMNMIAALNALFLPVIAIKDRKIMPENLRAGNFGDHDNVLFFAFSLFFYDGIVPDEAFDTMKNIETKIGVDG